MDAKGYFQHLKSYLNKKVLNRDDINQIGAATMSKFTGSKPQEYEVD